MAQDDLKLFEASEDADEEFYAGGGQFRRHGLEHFPQLWCQNGSYSVYGQVLSLPIILFIIVRKKERLHPGLSAVISAIYSGPLRSRDAPPCIMDGRACSGLN